MLTVAEAIAEIIAAVPRFAPSPVALSDALGLVLAEDVKLAKQLKVGVLAINTTNAPFSVKLTDLKLSQSPQ